MRCSFCNSDTPLIGTLLVYKLYRTEDKDYFVIEEEETHRRKGYFEVLRYCPDCLSKYCLGARGNEARQEA